MVLDKQLENIAVELGEDFLNFCGSVKFFVAVYSGGHTDVYRGYRVTAITLKNWYVYGRSGQTGARNVAHSWLCDEIIAERATPLAQAYYCQLCENVKNPLTANSEDLFNNDDVIYFDELGFGSPEYAPHNIRPNMDQIVKESD